MYVKYCFDFGNKSKVEELKDFKNGPLKGTYYINNELFALPILLSKFDYNDNCKRLMSISPDKNKLKNGNYSELISDLNFDRYGVDKYLYAVENPELASEDGISVYLAFMTEKDGARLEVPGLEAFLQEEIGLNVSVERGYEILENMYNKDIEIEENKTDKLDDPTNKSVTVENID